MGNDDPYPWTKSAALGDGDPFPLQGEDPFPQGFPQGKWMGGRGIYAAYRAGDIILVHARCWAPFSSLVQLVTLAATLPPTYGLGVYQTQSPLPAIRLFEATATFQSKDRVTTVAVWDVDGKHDVPVK